MNKLTSLLRMPSREKHDNLRCHLFLPALALLMLCGCTENKAPNILTAPATALQEAASAQTQDGLPDILVPARVMEEDIQNSSADAMTFRLQKESDDLIQIEPTSGYYNSYISPNRMVLNPYPYDGPWCDFLNYPQMEFTITNNQDAPLAIQSLDIQVEESKADTLPYLYLYQDGEVANAFLIWNEAWEDWGEISLDYKILKKNEAFDGHYDRNLRIPYFKDFMVVDLYQDLQNMGYKADMVKRISPPEDNLQWLKKEYQICGHGCDYDHLAMPYLFDWEELSQTHSLNDLFWPFEFATSEQAGLISACGFARLMGKISFEKSTFTKEFAALIYLSRPSNGGAEMELSEQFDVLLRDKGENYSVRKPYSATIMPGESERIRLTFKSQRSAIHQFRLVFNNENGLSVKSKKVSLHLLNGRHSSMQPEILGLFKNEE